MSSEAKRAEIQFADFKHYLLCYRNILHFMY